jgi:hypothetical protein
MIGADKQIKNENWYVKNLAAKINNLEIYKPKYQRKRKWDILPKKENVPSEKKYIEFLYDTYNSVHAITFGFDGNKYSNIDGNNRINAIMHFLEKPLRLFPEYMNNLIHFLNNKDQTLAINVENIIKHLSYNELMTFKYNKYFIENGHDELYKKHLKELRDELEPFFDDLINLLKINKKDRFDTDVLIIVNIFKGYSSEELAEVFGRINQYNSGLTEQEALASRLFNIVEFNITNKLLEYEIKQQLKTYYLDRKNDEILNCYVYDEVHDAMNAYDFMVGFQNYSSSKCALIMKTDNDGLSLFFKIYKCLFKGGFDTTFTTNHINEFIELMLKVIEILQKIQKNIFMENFTGGSNKIFDTVNKKLKSLTKNNLYLIITSIIGFIKIDISEKDILKSCEICILYHFFVQSLDDKDKKDQYKLHDGILYEAGGAFIDNKAKEYLQTPSLISSRITQTLMQDLLKELTRENVKSKPYELRTNRQEKRRPRKVYEKVLIYYYYICKVPTQFLNNIFWVEHIFPFSCTWENMSIDIDRLGNIFPIIDQLNKERSNKHINEYKKIDKTGFLTYVDIIPENYDEIASHTSKKPQIFNCDKFNDVCIANEDKLINCFIRYLF